MGPCAREIAENFFSGNNIPLVVVDPELRCVSANRSAVALFGRDLGRKKAEGALLSELVPSDDYPEIFHAVQTALSGGIPDKVVSIIKP